MWINYSEKATGCGLVFDNEFFKMEFGITKFNLSKEFFEDDCYFNLTKDVIKGENNINDNLDNDESYIQLQQVKYLDSKNIKDELKKNEGLEEYLIELCDCLKKIFEKIDIEKEEN